MSAVNWNGLAMGGGCHHERPEFLREKPQVESVNTDGEWLLAAAMLAQMAEDLAVMRAAGWWDIDPAEMRGRHYIADEILAELGSEKTEALYDAIRCATSGRMKLGTGWLVRMARKTRVNGRVDVHAIERRASMRLPKEPWTSKAGIDLNNMPKGSKAYQAERRRRILAAGYCMCGNLRTDTSSTYCPECLKNKSRTLILSGPRKRTVKPVIPPGAVPLSAWIRDEAERQAIKVPAMWQRFYRGVMPLPPIIRFNARVVFVMPEAPQNVTTKEEQAA